jgi:hypothetical protein
LKRRRSATVPAMYVGTPPREMCQNLGDGALLGSQDFDGLEESELLDDRGTRVNSRGMLYGWPLKENFGYGIKQLGPGRPAARS